MNFLGIIVSYLYIALVIIGAKIFEKRGKEASRKFIHIMLGNWWVIAMYFFSNVWAAIFVPVTFVIINYLSYKKDLIKVMERDEQDGLGTVYYAIALLIMAIVSFGIFKKPSLGLVPTLVMAYGDGLAAVIGKRVNNCNIRAYTDLTEQTIYLTNIKGIISSDTFVKVQRKLRRNRQFTSANKKGTILKELAGKLKCGHCHYAIKSYSKNKSGKPYLSCYGNKSLKICDKPLRGLNFEKLRITIAEQIQPVLDDLNEVFKKHKLKKDEMNKKIEEIQEEIKSLIGLAAKAKSEKAQNDILNEIEKKEEEITNLELELNLQLDIIDDFENLPFFDIVSKKTIKYHTLDEENKKIIVNYLIDKIYVYDKDNIEIIWKV